MKKKFSLMVVSMLGILVLGSVIASAKSIQFEINRNEGAVWVASNKKDLSGSQFNISNMPTAYSNFIEGKDAIGFRVKNPAGTVSYSNYHTFGNFVYRYPLTYILTPSMGADLRLNAQVDSAGEFDNIRYDGEWIS